MHACSLAFDRNLFVFTNERFNSFARPISHDRFSVIERDGVLSANLKIRRTGAHLSRDN